MAFTLPEIESQLNQPEYADAIYGIGNNPNIAVITDYLTGRSTSLQGIEPSHQNFFCYYFLDLLQHPANPTENDQLLLDVFFHPEMHSSMQYWLFQWLTNYLVQHDEEA